MGFIITFLSFKRVTCNFYSFQDSNGQYLDYQNKDRSLSEYSTSKNIYCIYVNYKIITHVFKLYMHNMNVCRT